MRPELEKLAADAGLSRGEMLKLGRVIREDEGLASLDLLTDAEQLRLWAELRAYHEMERELELTAV